MALLDLSSVHKSFGGLNAVVDFTMAVEQGELVGLIGPNGAGKTTVFNLITGVYPPDKGKIVFDGKDITGLEPYKVNRLGIARTFQNIRLFPNLTVMDNIMVAFSSKVNYRLRDALSRSGSFTSWERRAREESLALLSIFGMESRAGDLARNLPYGLQRRLEILRALATKPRLLLLDEPAAGMNPAEEDELIEIIERIWKEMGITIILIEHQMRVVMTICPRIRVMDFGETIAEGTPDEVRNNPVVIAAYLGRGAVSSAS